MGFCSTTRTAVDNATTSPRHSLGPGFTRGQGSGEELARKGFGNFHCGFERLRLGAQRGELGTQTFRSIRARSALEAARPSISRSSPNRDKPSSAASSQARAVARRWSAP